MIGLAGARTDTPTTAAATATTSPPSSGAAATAPANAGNGGHTANGITEVVSTATRQQRPRSRRQTAVLGATVDRVKADAEGAAFKALVTKADGTKVTVKLAVDYTVSSIDVVATRRRPHRRLLARRVQVHVGVPAGAAASINNGAKRSTHRNRGASCGATCPGDRTVTSGLFALGPVHACPLRRSRQQSRPPVRPIPRLLVARGRRVRGT